MRPEMDGGAIPGEKKGKARAIPGKAPSKSTDLLGNGAISAPCRSGMLVGCRFFGGSGNLPCRSVFRFGGPDQPTNDQRPTTNDRTTVHADQPTNDQRP